MLCLITNKTCFTLKFVHIRQYIARTHDRTLFILSVDETTSRGSSDLSQTKCVSANVVSLLNAPMPFVPEGLTSEIKPQIMQQQV